uniref:Secreted protein n=1 Tax=Anguilla anguilla TaxID=7936 RepID=A0A0E9P9F6_ANGAN
MSAHRCLWCRSFSMLAAMHRVTQVLIAWKVRNSTDVHSEPRVVFPCHHSHFLRSHDWGEGRGYVRSLA